MGSLGIENIVKFDYLEGPSAESISRAFETLLQMKAINLENGKITEKG
jgi:HrpA-like RNA helicase